MKLSLIEEKHGWELTARTVETVRAGCGTPVVLGQRWTLGSAGGTTLARPPYQEPRYFLSCLEDDEQDGRRSVRPTAGYQTELSWLEAADFFAGGLTKLLCDAPRTRAWKVLIAIARTVWNAKTPGRGG